MKNAIGSQCPTINIRQYQTANYINQICFCSCLFSVLDGLISDLDSNSLFTWNFTLNSFQRSAKLSKVQMGSQKVFKLGQEEVN